MEHLEAFRHAVRELSEAKLVLSKIGTPQDHLSGEPGKLSGIECKLFVHHQAYPSAKTYHGSDALNAALSEVCREHFDMLTNAALSILEARVEGARELARVEYEREFKAVDEGGV